VYARAAIDKDVLRQNNRDLYQCLQARTQDKTINIFSHTTLMREQSERERKSFIINNIFYNLKEKKNTHAHK